MPYRALPAALAAALLALGAPPALAVPTLGPLDPCYVSVEAELRERVNVSGAGFTPGAVIDVALGGEPAAETVADEGGSFGPLDSLFAPYRARGSGPFSVVATERDNPANRVELGSRVAALSMRLRPEPRRPRRKVTWKGLGFTDGKRLYAHYVREGRHFKTVRLGRAKGVCGKVKVKRRQFPFKPKVGSWLIRVDQRKAWSERPQTVFYSRRVEVSRAG